MPAEVGSTSHYCSTASARATIQKFLQRKRLDNPRKIIALQAQMQAHAQV